MLYTLIRSKCDALTHSEFWFLFPMRTRVAVAVLVPGLLDGLYAAVRSPLLSVMCEARHTEKVQENPWSSPLWYLLLSSYRGNFFFF